MTTLAEWRASLGEFPVVSWPQFVDVTHQRVNPLAGEEHLREVRDEGPVAPIQGFTSYPSSSSDYCLDTGVSNITME